MTERFLTVNGTHPSADNRQKGMIKTYSFTTDDDDAVSVTNSKATPNHGKLLAINSLSVDTINNEDDVSDSSTKLKQRKSRRKTEHENVVPRRRSSVKKYPSYDKINWSKPLMFVGMLIFIYLMWLKRDIWIPRLLTSNNRIRHSVITKTEQITDELTDLTSYSLLTTTTMLPIDSLSNTSHEEDVSEKVEDDKDEKNESEENNQDTTTSPIKSSSNHKLNINTRRNKLSFNQERQKKKRHHSQNRSVDDEKEDKPISPSSSSHSITKQHHRSLIPVKTLKRRISLNSNITLVTYDDIVNQLRNNVKSKIRNRHFLSTALKTTGLNKNQFYRLIYKKDYQFLTLHAFISLLNMFNLMLLIVPK